VYALQELVTEFLIAGEKATAVAEEVVNEEPTEEQRVASHLPQMASFSQREAPPGFVICDVCGEENNENNRVCEKCDVPLPRALHYVDLNAPEESEPSSFRAYPGRTAPTMSTRNGNHRKKVLLMLVVAGLITVWRVHGRTATVGPTLIPVPKMIVEIPAVQKKSSTAPGKKSASVKDGKATKSNPPQAGAGSKKEDPTEPEVVLRTFPVQTTAPSKGGDKKPAEKKSTLTGSTIPELKKPAAENTIA
jgi:hypothetical protein